MSHFFILMTITLGVNLTTRQMTPFFSSKLQTVSISMFHFCISRPLKFSWHYFLVSKIHIYMLKMALLSLLALISFLFITFPNFLHIKCFVPDPMDYRAIYIHFSSPCSFFFNKQPA